MEHTPTSPLASRRTNRVLTAVAVLLALNLLKPMDLVPSAFAQPGESTGLTSAIEQRKQMIAQLNTLEKKLEKIESTLAKGIKISEMPELKLPSDLKEAIKRSKADKPETPAEPAQAR
ncbi:MAG: hypothetical protein HEQ23_03585 [Tepidisphaera sp.]